MEFIQYRRYAVAPCCFTGFRIMCCLGYGSIHVTFGGDRNLVSQTGQWQCTWGEWTVSRPVRVKFSSRLVFLYATKYYLVDI